MPVTRSFDVPFNLRLNDWVNNREAGDLRLRRAHYDVIVMQHLEKALHSAEMDFSVTSYIWPVGFTDLPLHQKHGLLWCTDYARNNIAGSMACWRHMVS